MRFGGNDSEVLSRLCWIRDTLGPALGLALRELGGIALKPLIAQNWQQVKYAREAVNYLRLDCSHGAVQCIHVRP